MFVARVLVGKATGGNPQYTRPPPLDVNDPHGKSYDSCVDNINFPQIFVVFDRTQSNAEYLIEYADRGR